MTRLPAALPEPTGSAVGDVEPALAANATAYQAWATDESFDDYLRRLEPWLQQARPVAQ